MTMRGIIGVILLLKLIAMGAGVVSAQAAASPSDVPLTPQEQAARLWGLAGRTEAGKLFPSVPELVKTTQSDGRVTGGNVPKTRLRDLPGLVAHSSGAWYDAKHGLVDLIGTSDRGVRQGPDSVYWDPNSGYIVVTETKGVSAKVVEYQALSHITNQYSLRAARPVLDSSATREAKVAAARIKGAAQKGRLATGAIKAPQNRDPLSFDDNSVTTYVARQAHEIERNRPDALKYFRRVRLATVVSRGVAVAAFTGAMGLGWDAHRQAQLAWSMHNDSALRGSTQAYMQTGSALHGVVQAAALGKTSAAEWGIGNRSATVAGARQTTTQSVQLGAWKSFASKATKVAGPAAFIAISLGMEGRRLVMAFHEHGMGRIGKREFYRRSAGPAIMAAFTGGGAAVGGIIGSKFAGVGAIPGALFGASFGGFAAIPVQIAVDYMVRRYDREFDERQRRIVNEAVEKFYGLQSRSEVVGH
ncbi:MAG: hypothetical protein OXP66_01700 [Candidatus Tectomicrobia bacterium]|nr:hypothetical protein [Candidatus Tectomicrobia bacterium]